MTDPRDGLETGLPNGVESGDCVEEKLPVVEQWGLRGRRLPRPLPLLSSSEPGSMYFEVYQVPETHLTAILRGGGDWRWRFCSSEGNAEVTSGSYVTKAECIAAIDMLRRGATGADWHLAEQA